MLALALLDIIMPMTGVFISVVVIIHACALFNASQYLPVITFFVHEQIDTPTRHLIVSPLPTVQLPL
jgi:hypothetical protein